MQELQQTIAAQQLAAQREPPVPIGERNLLRNIPATRSSIAPPPCQRANFEIKPDMINLFQRKMFHGLSAEIPMEHIEAFEEICSFTRANGVPPDYIKCMLFPFSLEDKVRAAFLGHFYTKAKTTALRNKISSFKQLANEPFNEAWEWFNDTLGECPHHGFDDDHVLGIFYDGVEWEFRNALNAASNGDFMTQTTEGAHALIENMAASLSNKNEETDRSKKVNSMDTRKIDDLAAKVDLLLKNNQNQIYVKEQPASVLIQDQSGQLQRPISGKSVPKHWISEAIPSESKSEWKDVHPQPSTKLVPEQAEQSASYSSNSERSAR
ncbi:PREDICTED: uncharacterized protein LOC106314341 [Brassica oleracea var. oleracea]|uniref:uncharacterized protein LOC106314341 n=1 Tax=Brassica oleracea var. oleracea TaxID=109376 RepID=UPI0006A6B1E5|nr:PREDICTED: uncharacterized protein LOC106314341 [Brassica oleracea var. oleracea]